MELTIRPRDIRYALIFCMVVGGTIGYGYYDAFRMRLELERVAETKIDEWFRDDAATREDTDYLAIVDSGKSFGFFGRGWGVIHLYLREKGDVNMSTFKGIEFFFTRQDASWHQTDSAGCGALEHHIRAFEEFLSLGHDVPDRVFYKALGLDPDALAAGKHGHDHDHEHDHDHAHDQPAEKS